MTIASEARPELALSPAEARALTDRIKVAVEGTWLLIEQAYLSRAWSALGYPSWDDYCTREFGTARLRLPREERQEVVASLRESGLSTRAIGAAIGISEATVRNDLAASGAQFCAPEEMAPASSRTPSLPHAPARPTDAAAAPSDSAGSALTDPTVPLAGESAATVTARVSGTDGKSYAASRPAPATSKPRTDIPRVINSALIQIDSARRTLENLTRAQITSQSEEARRAWATNLSESIEALGGFLTNLSPEG